MAIDLILGVTKKNWARGTMPPTLALPPAEPAIECTDKEKAGLEKLASIKMRAEAGDRQAKIQWIAVARKFRATKARAVAGDPKAKRSLAILRQAGFLQEQRHLVRVRRTVEIEFEHLEDLPSLVAENIGTRLQRRRRCSMRKFLE